MKKLILILSLVFVACAEGLPADPLTAKYAAERSAVVQTMIDMGLTEDAHLLDHVSVSVRTPELPEYGCRRGQDVCYQTEVQSVIVASDDVPAEWVRREFIRAAMDQLDLNDRGQNAGYSDLFVQIRKEMS